jgi:hypothetical protein
MYLVLCIFWLAYDRLGRSSISYFVAYSVDILLDVQVMPRAVLGLYKHGTEAREGNTLVHQFPHGNRSTFLYESDPWPLPPPLRLRHHRSASCP